MKLPIVMATLVTSAALAAPVLADIDREEAAISLHLMKQSGVTATHALQAAQQAVTAVAYEYELEEAKGELFHEIKLINLDTKTSYKVKVSARDGRLTQKEEQYSCSILCDDDDVNEAQALTDSGLTLSAAIASAGLAANELLTEAELEMELGVRYIKLETMGPEGEKDRLIDIENGQLIPTLTRAN